MRITDDPYKDFDAWEREREAQIARLPVCGRCDNPIQDEFYWDIDGDILCEDCLDDFKHPVEFYYDD